MREQVLKVLETVNEEILTYNGQDMIGDGVIDSFQIIDIVEALEEKIQIEIDAVHIIAENFANKDSILSLMERLVREQ